MEEIISLVPRLWPAQHLFPSRSKAQHPGFCDSSCCEDLIYSFCQDRWNGNKHFRERDPWQVPPSSAVRGWGGVEVTSTIKHFKFSAFGWWQVTSFWSSQCREEAGHQWPCPCAVLTEVYLFFIFELKYFIYPSNHLNRDDSCQTNKINQTTISWRKMLFHPQRDLLQWRGGNNTDNETVDCNLWPASVSVYGSMSG